MAHFLVRSLAAAGAAAVDDPRLDEEHWTYTDAYAATMLARGPTLDGERREWTGSIHVVDLPDLGAVHRYVEHEPYHRAGAYRQHRIWRFDDLLGRTMWDTARVDDHPLYFAFTGEDRDVDVPHPAQPRPVEVGSVVVLGRLRDPDDGSARGIAVAAQVPSRHDLDAVLARVVGPTPAGGHLDVVDWEFGGRR